MDKEFLKSKQEFLDWVKTNYRQSLKFNEPDEYPCYIFDIDSDMEEIIYIYEKDLEDLNKIFGEA